MLAALLRARRLRGPAPGGRRRRLWDRHGAQLEPRSLRRLAGDEPALARALATAAEVAGAIVGLPALLAPGVPLARRLADWSLAGSDDQRRADEALVDLLLSPSDGRRAFLRRQLLPPLATIDRWMLPVAPRRRRLEQLLRPGKLGLRWAWRCVGLLR